MTHTDGDCPGCALKLADAHMALRDWFEWVKVRHPDVHIAWSFRDQTDQEACFVAGETKDHWPDSKHNFMLNDQPCAEALDIFEQINGRYVLDSNVLLEIANETKLANFPILWGGDFKDFHDRDHFELKGA